MLRPPDSRPLTIIAQDPSVKGADGRILTAVVDVPCEVLDAGPRGYRVNVVDYDSTRRVLYAGMAYDDGGDPYAGACDDVLLSSAQFHQQNVYAVVMRVLGRFEYALGRRVPWGFGSHQIYVLPHAFAETNAYYSDAVVSLLFGYFAGAGGQPVYTCLSHDIVAHETTHALLDGLHEVYSMPSGPDQAAFHEGLADIVALLSVFSIPGLVASLLDPHDPNAPGMMDPKALTVCKMRRSVLMGLAEQFGSETSGFTDRALRNAGEREPDPTLLDSEDFEECHVRCEALTGAVLMAFLRIWERRMAAWKGSGPVPVSRAAEEGVSAAEHLLTMAIRALDYMPPVDIVFGDYLSALLTADYEVMPGDGKYAYREQLRDTFGEWGIRPSSKPTPEVPSASLAETGVWEQPEVQGRLSYQDLHLQSLRSNPDEVFRFIWQNRDVLGLYPDAFTRVVSVRPCTRVAGDGFTVAETVATYTQAVDTVAEALGLVDTGQDEKGQPAPRISPPCDMPDDTPVRLWGGGTLIFNEFGQLKYHVRNRLNHGPRQTERLKFLWRNGIRDIKGRYGLRDMTPHGQRFALMHLRRGGEIPREEVW
jgi:hypothetical protein